MDGLEQAEGPDRVGRRGVVGHLERDLDVAHRAEVVDLVRLDLPDQVDQADPVGEVAVVQLQVRVVVQVVDPAAVEQRRAADQAVHLVALVQQQLGQVRAVLARDAGDERASHPTEPMSRTYERSLKGA
jgi:hypothetical protein